MYFRNKFNKEFLYLCNLQEPKGGEVRLDDVDHTFWVFRKKGTYNQPNTVHVIPLLLYNVIESSCSDDYNVENYMMICADNSDTLITCYYDPYTNEGSNETEYLCNFGIENITGDLNGEE